MLRIVLMVDSDDMIGVKETLKEYCERFGDVTVIKGERVDREGGEAI